MSTEIIVEAGERAKFTMVRVEHLEALQTEADRYHKAYDELHETVTDGIDALRVDITNLNDQHAAELAALREDYVAQGEMLEESRARVAKLEGKLERAGQHIAKSKADLALMEQKWAIERRNCDMLQGQIEDLHKEISRMRRVNPSPASTPGA